MAARAPFSRLHEKLKNPHLMRLASHLPAHKWKIILAVFCMLGAGASSSLIATLLGKLTDAGFYNQEAWVVLAAPIGLILVSLLHGGCMFGSNYLLGRVSQAILVKLRGEMFHRMLHWPMETYQANSTGLVTSKFVFEANFALSNAAKASITLIRDSIQVVSLTVVLFWKNWQLALISLVIAPMVAWLLRSISARMKKVMSSSQANIAELLVRVREAYGAERLIKISNAYGAETSRFEKLNAEIKDLDDPHDEGVVSRDASYSTPMHGGGRRRTHGRHVPDTDGSAHGGRVCHVLGGPSPYHASPEALGRSERQFRDDGCGCRSLFSTLDLKEERDEGTKVLGRDIENIAFEGVTLRYPNADANSVDDVSFTVTRGQATALVGLSGSGKTSMANMIPRFWSPTAGRILINGVDSREYSLESLRAQIAIVAQDVFLFDDTIRANITYGCPNASEEAVRKAIEDSALTEFIDSLPQGLDTPVGEAGDRLSGGQKQRISIARAFLKDAPILILDEPTSALDAGSEAQIKGALERLMVGRITFIVAHRLTTIEHADQILAMAGGKVVEQGTWKELLTKDGLFARLCRLQGLSTKEGK